MYSEFLLETYKRESDLHKKNYSDQLEYLIQNTSDVVGAQIRAFRNLGIEASCIIENATILQNTWQKENAIEKINSLDLVYNQIKKYKPDVLLIFNRNFFSSKWTIHVKNNIPSIKLVIGSHCAPYYSNNLKDFSNLDCMITCTPGLNNEFKKNKINSHLVYHGFDNKIGERIGQCDFNERSNIVFSGSLFLGGGFHNSRLKYIESILAAGMNMEIYGNLEDKKRILLKKILYKFNNLSKKINIDKLINKISFFRMYSEFLETPVNNYSKMLMKVVKPPVFGMEMYRLISNSKIIFNIHGDVANQYAGNVKLFEATGLGACLLTDNKKNISDLFIPGKEIVVYDGVEDCIEKIKWLNDNDTKRIEIAKAGQKKTLTSHTVEERCKLLIDIINQDLK